MTLTEVSKLIQGIFDNIFNSVTQAEPGGKPVNGMLLAANRHGLQPELLGLSNSGDTAGDKARVVGYASIAFTQAPMVPDAQEQGRVLLPI